MTGLYDHERIVELEREVEALKAMLRAAERDRKIMLSQKIELEVDRDRRRRWT